MGSSFSVAATSALSLFETVGVSMTGDDDVDSDSCSEDLHGEEEEDAPEEEAPEEEAPQAEAPKAKAPAKDSPGRMRVQGDQLKLVVEACEAMVDAKGEKCFRYEVAENLKKRRSTKGK